MLENDVVNVKVKMSAHSGIPSRKRNAQQALQLSSSNARKRQKNMDARHVASQTADAALSRNGELNIASFIKAREFELNAIDKSMGKARRQLATRAFQQVPRHLRRRTASHNAKKVPKRLRSRAQKEMREDNTPLVSSRTRTPTSRLRRRLETAKTLQSLNRSRKTVRQKKRESKSNATKTDASSLVETTRVPKIKKNKLANQPSITTKFKRRQVNKQWLPTHLWHTKRARMTRPKEPLWRMAIPLTPTEKSYRSTHRAAGERGCIAWDMSYISTIGCLGTESSLTGMLKALSFPIADKDGRKHRKWTSGSRYEGGWVRSREAGDLIGLIDVLWCAKPKPDIGSEQAPDQHDGIVETSQNVFPQRSGKERKKLDRRLFIRTHPSIFHQLWTELLSAAKAQKPPALLEDLRFEIGSIDVKGASSTEALVGVLRPSIVDGGMQSTWASLSKLSDPAILPRNALLCFDAQDPRISRVLGDVETMSNNTDEAALIELITEWPADASVEPSLLFSRKARHLTNGLASQKAIQRRKRETMPGESLHVTAQDPKIPIILLARRSGISEMRKYGTWTLLAPWKCIDPIWRQLLYFPVSTGSRPRFGGLNEKQQVAFENGVPWFPGDYPGTEAGKAWEVMQSEKRFDEWIRRPPSRRVAWEKLDLGLGNLGELGRGWSCDWEYLMQSYGRTGQSSSTQQSLTADSGNEKGGASKPLLTQRQRKAAKAKKNSERDETELTRRRNTSSPESDADIQPELIAEPEYCQLDPSEAQLSIQNLSVQSKAPKAGIASIKITLLTRGSVKAAARIYRLPPKTHAFQSKAGPTDANVSQATSIASKGVSLTTENRPTAQALCDNNSIGINKKLDLRSQWLLLDPRALSDGRPRYLKKDKANHWGLPKRRQNLAAESLRHINVMPKDPPAQVLEQYGWKPLSEQEKKAMEDRERAVKLEVEKIWDTHVPCPDADQLIGFVTNGAYNLAEGKGTAIGGIWLQKVLDGWQAEDIIEVDRNNATSGTKAHHPDPNSAGTQTKHGNSRNIDQRDRERHLCVIRNSGESVGRLGLWELCS